MIVESSIGVVVGVAEVVGPGVTQAKRGWQVAVYRSRKRKGQPEHCDNLA